MAGSFTSTQYEKLMAQHRPEHNGDAFSRRHPKMPVSKRAKIFLAFDALRGFDASIDIAKTESRYVVKRELGEEETANIDRQLRSVFEEYRKNKKQRQQTNVAVRFFRQRDVSESGEPLGEYVSINGDLDMICVEEKYLVIGGTAIRFEDLTNVGLSGKNDVF